MITIDGLRKAYDGHVVVNDVDLDLPDAGVTSIIGSNGAGKSTLLSLVSRLLGADAGTVEVDGLDVAKAPSRDLAKVLSVLRQDNHVTARLSVLDLVEFGRFPHSKGRLQDDDKNIVSEALDYCGLNQLAHRPLHELSGGQRQRAAVAMVLAQDTRYVLLDEPLNSLDLVHASGTMQLLRNLADDRQKSIVLVLHDINYASVYSDRIVAMRDGAVVHDGTPEETIDPEILERVYGVPVNVHRIEGDLIATYYRSPPKD